MPILGRGGGLRAPAPSRPAASGTSAATYLLSRPLVTIAVLVGLLTTVGLVLSPAALFGESRKGFGVVSKTEDDGLGVVDTASGPVTPADRDFLRQVRRAGLWEFPSGKMAQTRSVSASVKEAGMHLMGGHSDLDRATLATARALNVALPNEPNDQQKGFLRQLGAATGPDFDAAFANLLRRAHGKVLPVVAETRSKTQNTLVRQLADLANSTVLDHITMLEKTGKVDFGALSR